MTFAELGLAAPLLKALEGQGYTTPTPIQAKAIPPLLEGKDLLGIAQTGTGKTAAFALPILSRMASDARPPLRKGCRTLVLSPTRELATQIAESFRTYGKHQNVTVAVVVGGVAHRPQIQAMSRGVDVLVATPGRLLDHVETRTIDISGTEFFVLDEADQMLDLGFVRPIRQVVAKLAHRRQNLFFSATMPHEIAALAAELLRNPVEVAVTPVASTAERVSQRVIQVETARKASLLIELLSDAVMTRSLVFTRTKRGADKVARHLETAGINAASIHGNKSQRQREIALDQFRKGKTRVLVATDIAARGIDIDAVSHVVNYELPEVPEAYVHRIGRTARAGAEGSAISFCDNAERHLLGAIERLTRQKIESEDRRADKSIRAEAPAERGSARAPGANRGHRGSPQRQDRQDRPHRERRPETAGGAREAGSGFYGRDDRRPPTRTSEERASSHRADSHRAAGPRGDGGRTDAPRTDRSSRPERPWSNAPRGDRPRNDDRRDVRTDHRHGDDRPAQSRPQAERPAPSGWSPVDRKPADFERPQVDRGGDRRPEGRSFEHRGDSRSGDRPRGQDQRRSETGGRPSHGAPRAARRTGTDNSPARDTSARGPGRPGKPRGSFAAR